ncbi:hypothetical protein [Kribbella deserti]|uniref:IPT/TIG domain-containing protein n=1 Tax=Kribbella deserti TaxID=1926257 RepID=A0ABV6QPD4_9ACTN
MAAAAAALIVVSAALMPPVTAQAAGVNSDYVQMSSIPFIGASFIKIGGVRFVGNPADPITVTATEAADSSSVTVKLTSAAAGGLVISAPCQQTAVDTAVCPTTFNGYPVAQVSVTNASAADNDITMDIPTLAAHVDVGSGNDTVRIPHSREVGTAGGNSTIISLGNGNDTFYGGTGTKTIYADGGVDYIYVFNDPGVRDKVSCGNGTGEPRLDTVVVDSTDVLLNSNCLNVVPGP